MEIGLMTKPRAMDCTNTMMVPHILAPGSRTSSTVMVLKDGMITHLMRDSTSSERSTGLGSSNGQMEPPMTESSETTILRAQESTSGQMGASSLAPGSTTKCMGKALSLGLMAEGTKATTFKIKKKDTESSNGKFFP
jgi:hypothetical protein